MLKVLLVDDEPGIRMVLGDLIEDEGYQLFRAADGARALSLLDEYEFDEDQINQENWNIAFELRV